MCHMMLFNVFVLEKILQCIIYDLHIFHVFISHVTFFCRSIFIFDIIGLYFDDFDDFESL